MIAAIDCGTNTIKLLIRNQGEDVLRASRIVRLGEDVDATGRLSEAALTRAFAAIEEYAGFIAEHRVRRIRFCATSATRDSSNAAEFADGVRARLGVLPEVLSGAEEAELAYRGALGGLREAPHWPLLVLDIGGGSTELIAAAGEGARLQAHSMNIGSVRLHERFLHSDPPTVAEVEACNAEIDAQLDACPVDPSTAGTVIGVAGTTLSVVAGVLGLEKYDKSLVDQAEIEVAAINDWVANFVAKTVTQRLELPFLEAGRADVLGAGALILTRILARCQVAKIIASEADILDGIAHAMEVQPE